MNKNLFDKFANKFVKKRFAARMTAQVFAAGFALVAFGSFAQAQPVYPTGLTDIAAAANGGRIIASSSTFENDKKWDAANLIDGQVYNGATQTGSLGWSSNSYDPINMDSVTIGFTNNEIKTIGRIVLNPVAAVPPERWAKDVEVQVSTDSAEGPYRSAAIVTLARQAKPQSFLMLPAKARFVRLLFRSNQGSDRAVALGEVELYEAIPQTDAVGQLIARMGQAIKELEQYRDLQVERSNSSVADSGESHSKTQNVREESSAVSGATVQLIQQMLSGDQPAFPVSKTNIAAAANGGKVLNYSSLFDNDPKFAAKNLIDGNTYDPKDKTTSFGWSSEGFTPGREFVTFGFAKDRTYLIGKLVINPDSNQAILRWARRIDVQITNGSAKDGPWRTVETLNLRSEPVNQAFLIRPVEAKYVRLVFQANGPSDINLPGIVPGVNSDRSVSLGEVEIYEASSSSDVLDSAIGRFKGIYSDLIRLQEMQKKTGAIVSASDQPDTQTS